MRRYFIPISATPPIMRPVIIISAIPSIIKHNTTLQSPPQS
jgi:hypothetical protein